MSSQPPERLHRHHTALGWDERGGVLFAEGRAPLGVTIPREFGGPGDQWSPEELLVAATQSCMMATFTAIARRRGLPLAACQSSASANLGRVGKVLAFTDIAITMQIGVRRDGDRALAASIAEQAHGACFVASSLRCPVTLDYTIAVIEEAVSSAA